jgi:DNA invertase Pin-like site-specific DNA recombinase
MPRPHPFAAAPADKARVRAVAKPFVTVYGYARVSTDGQSVDAQVRQLRDAGAGKVFREVASGAKTDRPQLRKLLSEIAAADVLTVTRIDRLARSTFDLFAIVKRIVDSKAQFRSLTEPWADTGTSTGRLMIAVLGGLAEFERDLIRARTGEGRARAKARGKHMGRPPSLKHRHSRKKAASAAQKWPRSKNWPTPTT